MPPAKINLSFDFQIIPYTSLVPSLTKLPHEVHWPVTFTGKVYLMKTAALPGAEFHSLQELSHYNELSGSHWLPEPGGIVIREGGQEAFLVRYYPAGDLRRHFHADEPTKRSWVIRLCTSISRVQRNQFLPPRHQMCEYCCGRRKQHRDHRLRKHSGYRGLLPSG